MRIVLHLTGGHSVVAEAYAASLDAALAGTWTEITPQVAYAALSATSGQAIVRDFVRRTWAALDQDAIIAISEARPEDEVLDEHAERKLAAMVAEGAPDRLWPS